MQRDGEAPETRMAGMLASAEFDARRAPVPRLYLPYFGRVPSHKWLTYWMGRYRDGTRLSTISQAFADSGEFARRYGPLSNAQFVQVAYRNVYGRDPSPTELLYWTYELNRGAKTRGQVMVAFTESVEGELRAFVRVSVIMTVESMLGRAISATGYRDWVAWVTAGGRITDLIGALFDGSEYRLRVT